MRPIGHFIRQSVVVLGLTLGVIYAAAVGLVLVAFIVLAFAAASLLAWLGGARPLRTMRPGPIVRGGFALTSVSGARLPASLPDGLDGFDPSARRAIEDVLAETP